MMTKGGCNWWWCKTAWCRMANLMGVAELMWR
uniref:Uncharacterized protein n=1 Tax=Setaria viridis TaxID=4556 RepID=A0A4U6VHH0_SETVI|nr:hypothetical protein SEVIR_3G288850v2 [Setaria viridis]